MNTKNKSTELPEHYDPERVEQHVKRHWEAVDAYEHAKETTEDGEPFFFVDGPPNTSGRMHCGTAWGKILKDVLLRYYRMQGRQVVARPGYDTHGLPVERRNAADGKAVPPVHVGHGQGRFLDARQRGHIGHLLDGLGGVAGSQHLPGGQHQPGYAHLPASADFNAVWVETFQSDPERDFEEELSNL